MQFLNATAYSKLLRNGGYLNVLLKIQTKVL